MCAACASGTFSNASNADSCKPWSTCEVGSFASTEPSAARDRGCTACAPGTATTGPNQSVCLADEECAAGTQRTLGGMCQACFVGEYCAGGASAAVGCAVDDWDHDQNPATACVARTTCAAGSYVLRNGSATVDRACAPCAAGTFSLTANAALCYPWATCTAGSFVSNTPSSNSDRKCAACPSGSYTALENQSLCLAAADCAAGSVEESPATATTAAVCQACVAGQFCAGGKAPALACPDDTWDHDANPATACTPRTVCPAGAYAAALGSAKTDRVCLPCEPGTFSATGNATACTTWKDCAAGTYVLAPGTATADRRCEMCSAGSYTARPNEPSCIQTPKCPAGTIQTAAATDTTPVACKSCKPGEYCAGDTAPAVACAAETWDRDLSPATACAPKTACPAGTTVVQNGSTTTDRTCTACPAGTFNTTTNGTTCEAWSTCLAGTYVSNSALVSSAVDRLCEACPTGTYSVSVNVSACNEIGTCAAGTYQVLPVPSDAPPCNDCVAGQYCAGGTTPAADCAAGTWDEDENPATPCIAWTSCLAGNYVSTAGSKTSDQVCSPCASGTYTTQANRTSCLSCTPFTEDFSSNTQGWTLGASWQIGPATTWGGAGISTGNLDPTTDNTATSDNGIAGVVIGGVAPITAPADWLFITSPTLDLSGADPSLTLQFYRWLNSDYQPFMYNVVQVYDGTTWRDVWYGPYGYYDASWTYQSFTVGGYANANFQIRFGYRIGSYGVWSMSSWNLDDVKLVVTGSVCGGT